jgi:hypothetical protein
MRAIRWLSALTLIGGFACGTTTQTQAPASGGPSNGGADAGGVPDAGTPGSDAGGGGGGIPTDGGGTTVSDCDGLLPPAPGAPMQFTLADQDRHDGDCRAGETDGTGHIVATWVKTQNTEGESRHTFVDPATATVVGTLSADNMRPIGQASGFMGTGCIDGHCFSDYWVLSPTGGGIYKSPAEGASFGTANDPTGGLVHILAKDLGSIVPYRVEAVDASGAIRWSVPLAPPPAPATSYGVTMLAVDREGNVLVLAAAFNGPWQGQWISHGGSAGPQFQPFSPGQLPGQMYERVGNGLFLRGSVGGLSAWIGQFEPLATTMTPPPAWLAARPPTDLHMVHGGRGYAFLPGGPTSATCEQTIEVVSPSGTSCGASSFAIGGGSCATSSIIVGYDGTVVQQLPFEREASSCRAAGHLCNCTYRYWPGYFR